MPKSFATCCGTSSSRSHGGYLPPHAFVAPIDDGHFRFVADEDGAVVAGTRVRRRGTGCRWMRVSTGASAFFNAARDADFVLGREDVDVDVFAPPRGASRDWPRWRGHCRRRRGKLMPSGRGQVKPRRVMRVHSAGMRKPREAGEFLTELTELGRHEIYGIILRVKRYRIRPNFQIILRVMFPSFPVELGRRKECVHRASRPPPAASVRDFSTLCTIIRARMSNAKMKDCMTPKPSAETRGRRDSRKTG